MALAKCRECGREVSKSAPTCPGCGVKAPVKGWTIGAKIGAVVTALVVAGMCRSAISGHDAPAASAPAVGAAPVVAAAALPVPAQPAPPPVQQAHGAKVGETVKFSDSTWVVLKAERLGSTVKSNNQFQHDLKSEGGFFVRVAFKVTNLGLKEERLMALPKLKDSVGREFNEVDALPFYIPEGKHALMLEAIPPSLPKEFWSVYEVANDAVGLQFMARELSVTGETAPIDLALK
jgi:hypothetical protein